MKLRLAVQAPLVSTVASRASADWGARASADHKKWQEELEAGLRGLGLLSKLKRGEHHLSHAANAYLTSGFERALIVTLDGYGSAAQFPFTGCASARGRVSKSQLTPGGTEAACHFQVEVEADK